MATNDKVYTPEVIEDQPLPGSDQPDLIVQEKTGSETYGPKTIKSQRTPTKRIAHEVIGAALNTKSRKIIAQFEFTESGALQIGKYELGVSGDIRITPNGIVARDSAGLTTFSLDGETGDAVFKGTIQTGALIAGIVQVGDDSVVIDGPERQILIYNEDGIAVGLIGRHQDGF